MPKPTDYDKTHLRNMAAIGTRIDRIFKKAAEEAAKIGVSIKSPLPEDRIFSFDDYPETKKQIERLMTALQESMETTIVNGVRSSWTLSNNKNNALVSRIFGDRVGDLSKEQYRRYFSTNGAALDAFLQRKEQGLNLSDRVWRYTTAFKREIELGLDLGIRTGESADQMSRSLRQYLQHPDKLFRRVRDKHGNLKLSKAARDYHPGRGVYRSSYKNARRLACTETNIAYRTSDHLRWQQMEFVVGIEIKLSNNHTLNGVPLTDICDTLAGRYPKDFKFTGWHPHCRCHVVTVLKTDDEMAEDTQRILAGEQPKKGSVNTVRDVPDAFKGWVEEHADRIEMGGNLPYFVADNRDKVDRILTLKQNDDLEQYCEKHYTTEFNVHDQESYEKTMEMFGDSFERAWKNGSEEARQALVDYTGGSSEAILKDTAAGRFNEKAQLMDSILDRATVKEDIVLRSGQRKEVIEALFGKDFAALLDWEEDIEELNRRFSGLTITNRAYMSASFNERGGWSSEFELHIFAPKGTHMINASGFSKNGMRRKTRWDGREYEQEWDKGGESEVILHRGLRYKFIKAEYGAGLGENPRIYVQIVGEERELTKKLSPLDIAVERHDNRTPQQVAAIQQRWNKRRIANLQLSVSDGLLPKECIAGLRDLSQEDFNARIAYLQKTAKRHASRTPQQIEDIKKAWEAKQKRDATTKLIANNILKLRSEYPHDVDFSTLEKLIAQNNLTKMREEARNVAQAIKAIRAEEKALSDIIPNAHEWHKRFSIAQLQETKASVLRTFSKKGWGWDINNATELDALRRGLEHEVNWMGTKGKARYTTWEVSQSAYQEKLVWAKKRIEMLGQKNAIGDEIKLLRASRSTVGKQLVADFEKLFTDDATDINVLRAKAADIKAKADQLEKLRAKKAATSSSTASSGIPFGGMTDEEAKKALIDYANKIGTRIDPSKIVVDHGYIHLQGDQQMYLYEALKAETATEHKQLWNHAQIGGGHGGRGGYVQTGNSFVINGKFRNNGIFGKIDSNVEAQLRAAGLTADDLKTIKLLDKKIEEFSMPVPILATRYVDVDALTNIFGQSVRGKGRGTTASTLESWKKAVEKLPTKNMQVDPAYLSASLNEMQNVFYGNYRVKLQIEIPPGTPMYMTDNYAESEIVLGRGTQLEFIGVSIQTITRNFGWAGDQQYHHVTIRCRVKR